MKREILLERIDKLNKSCHGMFGILPIKLEFPTVLQPCTNTLRNMIDFQLGFESGISNVDKMSDIPLSVLENMSKKDMESFILYLRERPLLNANTTKQGVSQTTINRTLSAFPVFTSI